ncbi:zinc finger MYM-type protein 1-like [Pyrus x bretschneideri]|uniref:zinc finger MYM-type protein 1-like n=1 Tax=Pyrus x bretschneideri TaxID=225117 RepID=UPI00202F065D|nr:zinc finger MYM-type protein 1-like [Pyrus x bretschneideri]
MKKYFKRKSTEDNLSPSMDIPESSNENNIESISANLPGNPGLRLRISEYDPNIRDHIRRAYLQRELVQPRTHQFSYTSFAGVQLLFNPKWFNDFPRLEYSISKNAFFLSKLLSLQARDSKPNLAFRGHDENEDSSNKGNFLELLKFLADHNEGVKDVVFRNAPENLKLTSHDIQKDLVYAVACETTNAIMFDIGDDAFFSVLVEELHDILVKEQMAVVLRYVNTNGQVVERFMGRKHVPNTTTFSLKEAIDQFFSTNGLSISRLRGQGYDGSSNMQASCKRRDMVRERQQAKVMEAIQNYELPSGQGLNQETSLKHASDTHWGSHYGTLVSLINMFSSVIEVLEMIADDGVSLD